MEKKKQIGEHIVDHLSERMNEEIVDPVLDEWLAEDESNQEDFKRYKEIWKETGSYLEQETFNAQYAWDKIDRINKERANYGLVKDPRTYKFPILLTVGAGGNSESPDEI